MRDLQLDNHRENIINHLTECFSQDIITTEEYELRVEKANKVSSIAELNSLIQDLKRTGGAVEEPAPGRDLTKGRASQRVLCILSSQEMSGNWLNKDTVLVQAFMGKITCDLTNVSLSPLTRIQIYSVMAEVEILVPDGIALESSIAPILSEIKRRNRIPENMPGAPVIQIGGVSIMSEVRIES